MAEPSNKTQRQDWIDFPEEITASILSRLGAIEILVTAVYVCTTWRSICMDPRKWLTMTIRSMASHPRGTQWTSCVGKPLILAVATSSTSVCTTSAPMIC
ncbi:hypothetical protein ACLB2K_075333 [Fragaria x ananassa]